MSSYLDPNSQSASVRCVQCGYDLTGVTLGGTCPECGAPVNAAYQRATVEAPTSGHAIASLVLGIISIPTCFCYGIPALICGVLAIFFYKVTTQRMALESLAPSSKGMAIAGLTCGIIGTILGAAYILIVVIAIAASGGGF